VKQSLKSRAGDFAVYLLIALLLVGVVSFLATHVPDVDLSSQLAVAFLTGCILIVYVIQSFWRGAKKSSLILFCFGLILVQVALYVAAFRVLGRMTAIPAGLLTVIECALAWWVADKVLPRRNNSRDVEK
jgi:uncharacterized membrane protein